MTSDTDKTPTASKRPTNQELIAFGVEEQLMLFCDKEEFLQIANEVLDKYVKFNLRLPDDFLSHKQAWRGALDALKGMALAGDADRSYWAHELAAFDRAYEELDRMSVTPVVPGQTLAALLEYEAPPLADEQDAFICEMALNHNAVMLNEEGTVYAFTQEQLLAFTKANRGPMWPAEKVGDRSAAPQLRAMATNYPAGHLWDKLDATACIRGAFEIETLHTVRTRLLAAIRNAVYDPDIELSREAMRVLTSCLSEDMGETPIDMVLHCPACGLQHIDAPEGCPDSPGLCECRGPHWKNPPHRSHLCSGCKHVWRPADVPTNGVDTIKTKGTKDSPIAVPTHQVPDDALALAERRLAGLDAMANDGHVAFCFELDGGVHGTYEQVGGETQSIRYKNSVHEVLDALLRGEGVTAEPMANSGHLVLVQKDLDILAKIHHAHANALQALKNFNVAPERTPYWEEQFVHFRNFYSRVLRSATPEQHAAFLSIASGTKPAAGTNGWETPPV